MSDRYKKNMDIREAIVDKVLDVGDDGKPKNVPDDPKMLSVLNQLMQANDKVNMHNDRINSQDNNAAMDRAVAVSIAKATSGTSLRTRHDGAPAPTSGGPAALGSERPVAVDPGTVQPVGGDIDIDKITAMGRAATKGTGQDSED